MQDRKEQRIREQTWRGDVKEANIFDIYTQMKCSFLNILRHIRQTNCFPTMALQSEPTFVYFD